MIVEDRLKKSFTRDNMILLSTKEGNKWNDLIITNPIMEMIIKIIF